MINPKIAPPLPEEQTRVPVPDWMRKFQAAYSNNMLVGLRSALVSPARARAIDDRTSGRLSYWMLVKNFAASLVPFILVAGTLWLAWWYVVIHQQAGGTRSPVEGLQQLGTAGPVAAARRSTKGRRQPSTIWFGVIAAALRADDDALLLAARCRPA